MDPLAASERRSTVRRDEEAPLAPARPRSVGAPLTVYRISVTAVAAWSLIATTLLVWFIAQGSALAAVRLARAPWVLLSAQAAHAWEVGAVGAFALFVVAFLLCQAVGRGLLRLLNPRPLAWPSRIPAPPVEVRLLAFPSPRADAFTFTLLRPSWRFPWRREEIILVSDGLLGVLRPAEWEAVVAHELGHVRGFDGRYLTFLRTFARLMRWDPFLASVAARLTRREEFRADDDAVALTGHPRALARAIFKAAHLSPPRSGALSALLGPGGRAGTRQADERIRRLVALAETGRFEEEVGA